MIIDDNAQYFTLCKYARVIFNNQAVVWPRSVPGKDEKEGGQRTPTTAEKKQAELYKKDMAMVFRLTSKQWYKNRRVQGVNTEGVVVKVWADDVIKIKLL